MPKFLWLDDETLTQDRVFEGVTKPMWDLFERVRALDCSFPLLHLLDADDATLRTIDGIAFHLKKVNAVVAHDLNALVAIGPARRVELDGVVFFGITANLAQRQLTRDLCDWQDVWNTRLALMARVVNGKMKEKV